MNVSESQECNRSREESAELRRRALAELSDAVGPRWVTADPLLLDTYTWQYIAEMTTGSNYAERPLAVVLPADTDEVAEIVKICNNLGCQYKALSTGFGVWNAPTQPDTVVQIDLRRLDRIIKIDRENMYAVVEPYVTGTQLQTEAMKVGLNTHIVGAGGQTSILASATSMMGQSWDGITMGFSDRNLLGVEWVLPDGTIARVGSFEATGEYFSGDGPGFSLRGVMRGFGGALGGLGVFTKCAVKLYPWYGPARLEREGTSPTYYTRIPKHHAAGIIVVNSWDDMAELGYRLGEAEIVDMLGRNAPALVSGILTVDNNEFAEIYRIPFLKEMHYSLMFVIIAQDKDDFRYRMKTLKKIVKELDGGLVLSGNDPAKTWWMMRAMRAVGRKIGLKAVLRSIPGLVKLMVRDIKMFGPKGADYLSVLGYEAMVRSGMNMRGAFRFGGSFHTSMGALLSWDTAIRGARVGEQIKKKFIEKKTIFDDGADNAWGGMYEGGAYSHLEELAMYDPRDQYCREHLIDFVIETNLACIEHTCGDPINGIGPSNHSILSPAIMNYDTWQQKIKAALDPKNASDASFYTDPNFAEKPGGLAEKAMERVLAERAKIVLDE